jgi:Lrp/AsnC family leucine-responsive transcriptional regulator
MTTPEPALALDRIDHRIVDELRVDGRLSINELARRVGLSKTPCQVRLKRLLDSG